MKIFISGITGTLGKTVSRMLMARGIEIVGYSRDEQKQAALEKAPLLTLYLGDVRDRDRVIEATRDVDLIMHFAANKMVDVLELNPEESIATNLIGTMNILHAQRLHGIERVVFSSTDKAVYPINVYGASKMLAEKLVLRNPNNVVCRYGNVLGSRGSALPMFVRSLRSKEPYVDVTDVDMTRFWTTVDRAASFVISSALEESGGLKIPQLQAAPVLSVIKSVADLLDIDTFEIDEVGIRPGEKIHECLMNTSESVTKQAVYSDDADAQMSLEDLETLVAEAMREL